MLVVASIHKPSLQMSACAMSLAHGWKAPTPPNQLLRTRPLKRRSSESAALAKPLVVQIFPARAATAAFNRNCRVPILGKDHNPRRCLVD